MKKFFLLALLLSLNLSASALQIGNDAPEFILQDQEGYSHSLLSHRGSYVLLFFYPKDFTPPAQKKMKAVENLISDSITDKLVVYGISSDSVAKHRQFYDKMHISFDLLSDMDKKAISAYDADGFLGTKPVVILIGPDGRLFKLYDNMQKFLCSSSIIKSIINNSI
jgi:thioredoxin-dependent peroxiredoxin